MCPLRAALPLYSSSLQDIHRGGCRPPQHEATKPEGQGLQRMRLRSERPREVKAEPGVAERGRARHGQDSGHSLAGIRGGTRCCWGNHHPRQRWRPLPADWRAGACGSPESPEMETAMVVGSPPLAAETSLKADPFSLWNNPVDSDIKHEMKEHPQAAADTSHSRTRTVVHAVRIPAALRFCSFQGS